MKKTLATTLVCALLLSSLTACSGGGGSQPSSSAAPASSGAPASSAGAAPSDDSIVTAPGELPIVKEGADITLTIFNNYTDRVTSFKREDNKFTAFLEDLSGVKLEITGAPQSDAKTKMNLVLNSGELPDIIMGSSTLTNTAELSDYGAKGVIIPLDDLFDKYAHFAVPYFEEAPVARNNCTGADGHLYSLPDINNCYHCIRGDGRGWIYGPFLEALNMEVPDTTEDFKNYLIAVRDNDPNGNGQKDEVPIGGDWSKGYKENGYKQFIQFFGNTFGDMDSNRTYLDESKKLHFTPIEDSYKEMLIYLADLYAEGLIAKNAFTATKDELIAVGETPDAPVLAVGFGWGPEEFTKKSGDSKRWYQYFVLPPLTGPRGTKQANQNINAGATPKFAITSACEYPEVAFRLGDLFFREDVSYNAYIGMEGECWQYINDPNKLDFNGQPAYFEELVIYGSQPENSSWDQTAPSARNEKWRLSQYVDSYDEVITYLHSYGKEGSVDRMAELSSYNEIMKLDESKEKLTPYAIPAERCVPTLVYGEQDATSYSDLKVIIDDYIDEMTARFVTGEIDVESGWADYVGALEGMGVQNYISIMQNAYDSMYGSK
ncbi:MAG: extracellular solute-binding protein [Provencibacterium sp.]|nr:extracellular solute-binding protein [Provencibacterium sp.]